MFYLSDEDENFLSDSNDEFIEVDFHDYEEELLIQEGKKPLYDMMTGNSKISGLGGFCIIIFIWLSILGTFILLLELIGIVIDSIYVTKPINSNTKGLFGSIVCINVMFLCLLIKILIIIINNSLQKINKFVKKRNQRNFLNVE